MNISAVIIAKNSETTIRKTLESLKDFDDVVVYDNGSTDSTISIAKEFVNVNLIQGEFKGYGWTKNNASSYAKHDWIVIIDSDEVIDKQLNNVFKTKKLEQNTVYMLNFYTFYKEKQVKYCGWSNQKIKRVYNKSVTHYNSNDVHENIISDNMKIEILDGHVNHYSYCSLSQFILKANKYSTLFAQDNMSKRNSSPLLAFSNGLFSFFKTYVLKLGFLDGYVGLVIAFSHMITNFFKYMKLYELNKKL
jgi:glycosyltransferase involved in cell wall biosynthesis